ncbi:TRIC cation channel family protein [Corallococcus sp. AS-1-12]|uniref:TRIC cation channel family protein n=1 Tax=Corallococcus sp. AS-1-12 TaxID=2874598 RepID=UPI001CBB8D91|nr:TRIC cation channel family protein [Corallococcus sp. AS-1-12]MBZ4335887.1 TRIC cation channel family protein [Corallococcus sp. AS-1-12]
MLMLPVYLELGAVGLGVVTSVGGGVIRDVLLGERTALVAPGELFASVALPCGLLYVALAVGLEVPAPLAEAAAIAGASLLRLTAMWHRWRLPPRFDLLQLLDRLQARRQRGPP